MLTYFKFYNNNRYFRLCNNNVKQKGTMKYPPEVWKTKQFNDILLQHCNAIYNQSPINRWTKGRILSLP